MSSKEYCPRPDYTKYESNSFFYGSIVSSYSKLNRLVYCVNSENIENFLRIDDYKFYKKLPKKPAVGAFFVYFSSTRNSYYRAYNLGANPVEPVSIKAFFFDTGEVHYLTFDKKKFFYLPEALFMPPMAIFVKIKSIPKKFKSGLEFLEKFTFSRLRFNITEKSRAENDIGIQEECLVVDIEQCKKDGDSDDEDFESALEVSEDEDESGKILKLTKSTLLKFNSQYEPPIELTYKDGPFMSSEIPKKPVDLQSNQKVLVYPAMMAKANLFYGICKSIHQACCDINTLTELMIKMNKFNINYEKIDRMPILNEMVFVREKFKTDDRKYRGMVLEVFDEICMILYVDYGKVKPFHYKKLFKFPIEFSKTPFHAFRIHASNIQMSDDEAENHKNMSIVDANIKQFCYGIVEKCDGFDILIKLFDKTGHNLKNVIERINRPLRLPKVSNIVKNRSQDEHSRD